MRLQELVAKDALTDDEIARVGSQVSDPTASLIVMAYGLWAMRPPNFTTCIKAALMGGSAPHALAAIIGQMLGGVRGQSVIPSACLERKAVVTNVDFFFLTLQFITLPP